jgi:hypothetical protein
VCLQHVGKNVLLGWGEGRKRNKSTNVVREKSMLGGKEEKRKCDRKRKKD